LTFANTPQAIAMDFSRPTRFVTPVKSSSLAAAVLAPTTPTKSRFHDANIAAESHRTVVDILDELDNLRAEVRILESELAQKCEKLDQYQVCRPSYVWRFTDFLNTFYRFQPNPTHPHRPTKHAGGESGSSKP
jgi:hypothetical protein